MFEDIRKWGDIRGLVGDKNPQIQIYRLLEEISELHKAVTTNDIPEVEDAVGDIIVVLTQLMKNYDKTVEECIDGAFGVIKLRKGLTIGGEFIRYGKLSEADRKICDTKQGNSGNQYFTNSAYSVLGPDNFKKG